MKALLSPSLARTSFYLLAAGAQHLGSLLLLPLLVASLSAEEFSRYGLMTSAFLLLATILSLNMHRAPVRLYFDHADAAGRARLLASTLSAAAATTGLGLLLILGALAVSGWREPISGGARGFQSLVALIVLAVVVADFGKLLMKIRGDARRFAFTAGAQSFGLLALFLLLRELPIPGLLAAALAHCGAATAVAAVALAYARPHLRGGHPDREPIREAFLLSWPTVVHMVALWGVGSSGRWIGAFHVSLAELAPYTLLTALIGVVGMATRAFFEARIPEFGAAFAAGQARRGARVLGQASLVAALAVLAVYALAWVALFRLGLRLPSGYQPTPALLALAAAANLLESLFVGGVQTLNALKKTHIQATSTVFSGLLTVLLSLLLVRSAGASGLMVALVAGMALQALTSNFLARRHIAAAG